jgi:membrane fusion protein, multidrug efflux system
MHSIHHLKKNMLIAAALFSLAACSKPAQEEAGAPPAVVTVLKLQAALVVLSDELPGRVAAFRTADIRPQVGGIVLRRQFEQGAEVKAGQKLFQLNPAPFQADVDSAAAALQHAVATAKRASSQADRLKPLVEADAISRQAYDDAVAQREQAVATVAQAQASLARRRLDLAFASIEAPISGRIGSELVTEGALVGLADATPMARIQQIDKVYVDVRQPAAALAALQASGNGGADKLPVTILGADGQPHPVTGRILFSGISVDAGTGDAVIRVLVDNPQRQLLPGMFVRARIARAVQANGVLVPQQAVLRSSDGQAQAWVLDGTHKASLKPIAVGDVVEHQYVVNGRLKAGDTVVIEGQERLQPGATAAPQAWKRAAAVAKAPPVSAVR